MRNKIVLSSMLLFLVACSGAHNSNNTPASPVIPPNNPPTAAYGTFRPLKASTQGSVQSFALAGNQSITMSTPRHGHKAISLGNGKFLLFGGEDGTSPSVFDEFDSSTERFTALSVVTKKHRSWNSLSESYAMLKLPDGRVLICGGTLDQQDMIELYNPATQSVYSRVGSVLYNQVTNIFYLGNNKVLLFGLAKIDVSGIQYVGNGILDYKTYSFNLIATPEKTYGMDAVQLSDGSIIYAGGVTLGYETSKNIYQINPTTLVTTKIGELQTARLLHGISVLADGDIGIYGGVTYNPGAEATRLSSVEIISTKPDTFGQVTSKVPLKENRSTLHSVLLQNGYVLNAGGTDGDGFVTSSEFVHNHTLNVSGTTGNLNTPRRMYSAVFLNNGRVLISGGNGNSASSSYDTAEIYDPAQKIIISYDSANDVPLGTVVHFTSDTVGTVWTCSSNGTIDSNGVLTTTEVGIVTVTGTASNGAASVSLKILPVE